MFQKYDLKNENDKRIIKDFEKEFLSWLKDNPNKANWKNRIFAELIYFQEKGAIKICGDITKIPTIDNYWPINYNIIIGKERLFEDLQEKFQALNELRYLRERAKKHNEESLEQITKIKTELKNKFQLNKNNYTKNCQVLQSLIDKYGEQEGREKFNSWIKNKEHTTEFNDFYNSLSEEEKGQFNQAFN